jgi:phytoene dehydrogenase-like protein
MEANAMAEAIPKSTSRKVNGYVKAVRRLEEVRRKREERYDRYVRPLDRKRDVLMAEVDRRMRALIGTQQAEARRILGAINGAATFKYKTE